jgi:hypothetical protein
MALLTAQGIANVVIPLIKRKLTLVRTVTMVPAAGFTGPNGETISVRVRQPRASRTQTAKGDAITYDDQNEVSVEVTLSHLYDAYHVSDEDLSLELEDFASQITEPQVTSVATGAEDELGTAMNDLTADATIEFGATADADDTVATILAARQFLSEADAPADDRWFAVSPSIATRVLSVPQFVRVNESGQASALRDAVIGRLYGFTFVESNGLDTETAVAYHRSGFCFASKKPADPRGAKESFAISQDGINIRQIFQYDPDVLSDASVLSTFGGASAVFEDADDSVPADNSRFIKIGVGST